MHDPLAIYVTQQPQRRYACARVRREDLLLVYDNIERVDGCQLADVGGPRLSRAHHPGWPRAVLNQSTLRMAGRLALERRESPLSDLLCCDLGPTALPACMSPWRRNRL